MSHSTRIVIIGGGILGCSAAFHLMKQANCEVVLLEAATLAAATTSSAAALLTRARQKPVIADLVRQTFLAIDELECLLNEKLPYNQAGSLHIASRAESERQIQEMAELAEQQNLPVHWLSSRQVAEACPWLQVPEQTLAALMPEDGFIDPYQLAMAYAQAARLLSSRSSSSSLMIRQNSRVASLLQTVSSQGAVQVTGVELADGEKIMADIVIDAAGPWSTMLARQVGVNLAMAPVRSHYWMTGKLASVPVDSPMVILPDARAYARPEVGHLLFGLRDYEPVYTSPERLPDNLAGFSFGCDEQGWEALEAGFEDLLPFFPELAQTEVEHYISGISSYTPDGSPLIGTMIRADGSNLASGFLAMTGCSGGGIGMSGGLGRLIAELATGQVLYTDASTLALNRFGVIDPLNDDFQKQCALARCGKRSG
ncbi:NAD(P)/FAD-dependent oxidoreductase [Oceanospirillum sediminis]|uniref:FAD-binding oxidoreductase n=1 Tax=Oceanospirillum sediminis TaxID=2760088 RepID=A0A839ILJ2_9GAMM|nr:FAD-dependent oxidoreductase [Oceanospirillum sediminis]MBB1485357.1 FAD-binding oxidoreductase [Oceanospirillum sediminis]